MIGGAVLLVAAVGVAFVIGQSRKGSQEAVPAYRSSSTYTPATYAPTTYAPAQVASSAPTTGTPVWPSGGYPSTAASSGSSVATEAAAHDWLNAEASSYRVTTDGHYLVELSAKYIGAYDPQLTAANGTHTFYFTDIVAEYQQLRDRFGSDVHLVRSTQYGKQTPNSKVPAGESIYVTVYDPGTFAGTDSAQSWCQSSFPGLTGSALDNVCLVRQASAPH
ncbi:hypothetical protein [Raineyella sp. W15-4]|uniref:hypothetical protein n=1 Tax=Raineyella sp. W15-4 TaxID=3081651 RepID=UPI002953E53F|nr:hypothetical protein [Raineyella sp. W15-4]WOQ16716.1 hypothetical protein R0145_16145 [Raineyella sp. W15-4]